MLLPDLISSWDNLKISSKDIDLAGCLIPHDPHVNAGPNARRFIKRPEQHSLHEKYVKETAAAGLPTSSARSLPPGDPEEQIQSPNKDGILTTAKCSAAEENVEGRTIIRRDDADVVVHVGKKTLHSGIKKHESNETSLEFYYTLINGVHEYHKDT